VAAGAVFVTFVFTTLIHEPASIVTLAGVLVLSAALDYGWKHFPATRAKDVRLAHQVTDREPRRPEEIR
jgi:hypothetical protein